MEGVPKHARMSQGREEQTLPSMDSKEESPAKMSLRAAVALLVAAVGGEAAPKNIWKDAAAERREQISKQERVVRTPAVDSLARQYPSLQALLEEIGSKSNRQLIFRENLEHAAEGRVAGFMQEDNQYDMTHDGDAYRHVVFWRGVVEYVPFELLDEKDKSSFASGIYHEAIHARQSIVRNNYIFEDNTYNTPDWRIAFYDAAIPALNTFALGEELEANYEAALFEQKEMGAVDTKTLFQFFVRYMQIRESDAYRDMPEVRTEADRQHEAIYKITGHTLDSFMAARKKK